MKIIKTKIKTNKKEKYINFFKKLNFIANKNENLLRKLFLKFFKINNLSIDTVAN